MGCVCVGGGRRPALEPAFATNAILADVHLGRLISPDEIAGLSGYCMQNRALNVTTIEITGGLCYPRGIAK